MNGVTAGPEQRIEVKTPSAHYQVKIASGILDQAGEEVASATGARRCVVVSGEVVFPLYGERVLNSLRQAGLDCTSMVFPTGEETKSLRCYGELLETMAARRLSRTDCLVALGGGVTGDLTGFAAATYQRGIPFVQIPTTLLAAVDSSVGGKTAVNLPSAKNQVGAFHQPALVLCDPDTLRTLPERQLRAGLAEVIKTAVIGDPDLFDALGQGDVHMEEVIAACVRLKAEIVAEDERDTGRRRLLNLGHTFGHAVESRSGYQMLHGEAVAAGLGMIARASARMGYLDGASRDAILDLLKAHGLPTESPYPPEELYETLLLDKKIASGRLHLVVPRLIGLCETVPVMPEELRHWLEEAF